MKLKKIKIISVFGIFIICFFTHSLYQFLPCIITSILFPVNESIFEHMKMIMSAIVLWSLIENILLKKNNIIIHNYSTSIFVSIIMNIIIFLVMYLPIYYSIGESLSRTIILLFISICITQYISYLMLKKNNRGNNKLGIILIILLYIISTILTYNPPHISFFKDSTNNTYGIITQ